MSNVGHVQRNVSTPKPKTAYVWWSYILLLLVFGDAGALTWFFAFVAPATKESFEQWEILLGIFGIGMEL